MTKEEILEKFDKDFPIIHYECEDCWYSCPKSESGCCNDYMDKNKCACGAEFEHEKMRKWLNDIL